MGDLIGLAHNRLEGLGPTFIFLPGYASDMAGSKALALEEWARDRARAFLRFDYRGCGESAGAFEDFTLADWRDDALAAIDSVDGPVVLVGSSMGGWIMLLAALARVERVTGLIGLAAAPDFTDWGFTQDQKLALLRDGRLEQPNPYGHAPTVTTKGFWQAGEANRVLTRVGEITCPVRLLHGQRDPEVSWQRSLALAEKLGSDDVQVTFVKDGDHRLSREQDLALLLRTVDALLERP